MSIKTFRNDKNWLKCGEKLVSLQPKGLNMENNDSCKLQTQEIALIRGELFNDACSIIEQAQASAYHSVNETIIKRNWLLGMRIRHEVLKEQRAEYGEQVIKKLAKDLTAKYGKGFNNANLYHFVAFYNYFPNIFHAVSRKSDENNESDIFYAVSRNYHLRCFVLIDLKTKKLCYQDVGQMDMYVKMYDELVRPEGHNPTIGILLCADTDEDVAHYSVLNGNDQLFAAKYLTYMPTQEELRREIEQQKEFFRLQNGKSQ